MRKRVRLASKTYLTKQCSGNLMTITRPPNPVPVRPLHTRKFTVCIPTGSTILSTAPAEGKEKKKDKMRNEEARAAGLKTY